MAALAIDSRLLLSLEEATFEKADDGRGKRSEENEKEKLQSLKDLRARVAALHRLNQSPPPPLAGFSIVFG